MNFIRQSQSDIASPLTGLREWGSVSIRNNRTFNPNTSASALRLWTSVCDAARAVYGEGDLSWGEHLHFSFVGDLAGRSASAGGALRRYLSELPGLDFRNGIPTNFMQKPLSGYEQAMDAFGMDIMHIYQSVPREIFFLFQHLDKALAPGGPGIPHPDDCDVLFSAVEHIKMMSALPEVFNAEKERRKI